MSGLGIAWSPSGRTRREPRPLGGSPTTYTLLAARPAASPGFSNAVLKPTTSLTGYGPPARAAAAAGQARAARPRPRRPLTRSRQTRPPFSLGAPPPLRPHSSPRIPPRCRWRWLRRRQSSRVHVYGMRAVSNRSSVRKPDSLRELPGTGRFGRGAASAAGEDHRPAAAGVRAVRRAVRREQAGAQVLHEHVQVESLGRPPTSRRLRSAPPRPFLDRAPAS